MSKEDLEFIVEFLENQGFSYYADQVRELFEDIEKLAAQVEDLQYDKIGC